MTLRSLSLLIYSVALVLGLSHAHAETQSGETVSKSIMMLCSDVELRGSFIDGSGATVDHDTFVHCANAFQISNHETLTAAHVVKLPQELIAGYFEQKLGVFSLHGFVPGLNPKSIDSVSITQSLIAADGTAYVDVTRVWGIAWSGVLDVPAVGALLNSFTLRTTVPHDGTHRMSVEAVDTERDLAYLTFTPTHALLEYPTLSDAQVRVGMKTINVSAVTSGFNNGHLQRIVYDGTITDVNGKSADPNIKAGIVVIATAFPTQLGYSGGFSVTPDGVLVGVTHATTAFESSWTFDIPLQCNTMAPCRRSVISRRDITQFLKEYRRD